MLYFQTSTHKQMTSSLFNVTSRDAHGMNMYGTLLFLRLYSPNISRSPTAWKQSDSSAEVFRIAIGCGWSRHPGAGSDDYERAIHHSS